MKMWYTIFMKTYFSDKKTSHFATILMQFIKFGIVGATNTLVFLAVYYPLITFGVHYLAANLAAFTLGTLNAYIWNSRFVFKNTDTGKPKAAAVVKVYATYALTFTLSSLSMFAMVDILGISPFIAPIINVFFTTPINFLLIRHWAFRQTEEQIQQAESAMANKTPK